MSADFTLEDHGSIALLRPNTTIAASWLEDNIYAEPWQWFGQALSMEPRLAPAIVEGIMAEGLTVACV